jgi:hydrogenase maturation protease
MPKTLLLGLGNDILSDDGVGLRVAAALRRRLANHRDLTVVETAEMGLSLLDQIVDVDVLVLVDAVLTGKAAPGFVHELDGADLATLPAISPHFLGVGETLALGRKLGLSMPNEVRIFAIEVADPFTVSTQLTPELESALPGIIDRIARAVEPEP